MKMDGLRLLKNLFINYAKRRRHSKNDEEPWAHHIIWLLGGGEDTIQNTVALCPNCHRKMHVLNLEFDLQKLK